MAGIKKSDKNGAQVSNGRHREKHPNNPPSNQNHPKSTKTEEVDFESQQSPLYNFYKTLLGIVVILFILSFISGQKWNEMKRASYYTSKRQLIAQERPDFVAYSQRAIMHTQPIFIVFKLFWSNLSFPCIILRGLDLNWSQNTISKLWN